jgi:hypothetical protein
MKKMILNIVTVKQNNKLFIQARNFEFSLPTKINNKLPINGMFELIMLRFSTNYAFIAPSGFSIKPRKIKVFTRIFQIKSSEID